MEEQAERHASYRAFKDSILAGLRRYEEEITRIVNEYLAGMGAQPVKAVILWPKCAHEEDSTIAGAYDNASRVIYLYYCPSRGFDVEALAHEIVHHLQNTEHPSVEVRGRDLMDVEALLYPYHERPHEKEAFNLQAKVAGELLAGHPRLAEMLEEASKTAAIAGAVAGGELVVDVECRGIPVEDWRAVEALEALAGLLGPTGGRGIDVVEVGVSGESGSYVNIVAPAGSGGSASTRLRITVEVHPAFARFLKGLGPLRFEAGRGGPLGRLSINIEKPFLGPGLFPRVSLRAKLSLGPATLVQAARRRQGQRDVSSKSMRSRRDPALDALTLMARLLCYRRLGLNDARASLDAVEEVLRSMLGNRREGYVAVKLDCNGGVKAGSLEFKVMGGGFEFREDIVEYAVEVSRYASRMLGGLRDVRDFCAAVWESWRRFLAHVAESEGSDLVEIVDED